MQDEVKLQKLQLFLSHNDGVKPQLPSPITILQLLRQYLNDDDFILLRNGQPVFSTQGEQERIQSLFQNWKAEQQGELNIDDFIEELIGKDSFIDIDYSLYDDQHQSNKENKFTQNKQLDVFRPRIRGKFDQQKKDLRQFKQKSKDKKQKTETPSQSTISFVSKDDKLVPPEQYLRKFFIHYSKKQVNSLISPTFGQCQQYYNTISLTKWMHYVRQIGLVSHPSLNSRILKQIFLKNENKDKVLNFELFQKAVNAVMKVIYGDDRPKIEDEGYILLGIKNKQAYQSKFKKLGMLAPIINKPMKIRISEAPTIASQSSLLKKMVKGIVLNRSHEETSQVMPSISRLSESHQLLSKPRLIRNTAIPTEQCQPNSNILFPPTFVQTRARPIRHRPNQVLEEIIHSQEDDPYLRRYNSKENSNYRCVANRIDSRIEKIMAKYQ